MDLFDALLTRRSIRSYTDQPISEEDLQRMLEAAMSAPSACNCQCWRFVVITGKDRLAAIPAIHPHAGMAARAPMAVLVCADTAEEKIPGFWVQDCSAALQNFMLAARGLQIGTVWCGIHPSEERETAFKALFGLPESFRVLGLVVMGHPKQPFVRRDTFDPAKVRRESW